MHVRSNVLYLSREVRQTQLRCEKLRVSLRDVNLNQNNLLALLPLELSKMCFNDRLLGLRKIAVLLHEVAAGKLPLIVLPASCINSCVKPYYFHSAFLRSGFHSCPSTYSCDCCINYCGFDICHKYFSILMKHGTRKL